LSSIFWGVANRESTQADGLSENLYEQYQRSKPAGYTSVLLIILVVLGIFAVLASIFFEYHQVRTGTKEIVEPRKDKDKDKPNSNWT